MAKKSTSKTPSAPAVDRAAPCSHLDARQKHLFEVVEVWLSRAYQRTPKTEIRARTAILKATQSLHDLMVDIEGSANNQEQRTASDE